MLVAMQYCGNMKEDNMKIRYIVGIAYLSYIGMMGGTIIVEAIIVGLVLGMYDFLFNDRIV